MRAFRAVSKKMQASRALAMLVALALTLMICASAAFTYTYIQTAPTRAQEANKPTIVLEANAVVDAYCKLTGEMDFSIYVTTNGTKMFSSVSLVMGYGPELTPCDTDGNPLPIEGEKDVTMPTISQAEFTSSAYVVPSTGGGGHLYMSISTTDMPRKMAGSAPLSLVKFKYDATKLSPWMEDEKNGPHWIDNKTPGGPSLLWLAKTTEADRAPWGCRLLYASGDNLYYSSDATEEEVKGYLTVAPEGDFESNRLSYSDDNSVPQDQNTFNIRTRLVNEATHARPEDDESPIIIMFYGNYDELIGVLSVPADEDARPLVNEYVKNTMVHPDLRDVKNVSSLKREDTYRGAYDGRNTTDGSEYPLTNVFDYVFMKRPMRIINENTWEQKKDENGNALWDDAYPWAYGWSVVPDPNFPQAVPSIMGIGELGNYSGAYSDSGAYRPMNGAAAELKVSTVGYSHWRQVGNKKEKSINSREPMTTQFMFADFNFSHGLPPVDLPKTGGNSRVLCVKACYEPGEKLISGKYELEEKPYGVRLNCSARQIFELELSFTRIVRGEDGQLHGVPLIREPGFVAAYTSSTVRLGAFRMDENDTYHPVRYSKDKGYEYQQDDGTWVHMPNYDEIPVPDGYVDPAPLYVRLDPYTANTAEVKELKHPCVFGENDDTEGYRQMVYSKYEGKVDLKRAREGCLLTSTETGFTVWTDTPSAWYWDDKNIPQEEAIKKAQPREEWNWDTIDYCLVEMYGGTYLEEYSIPRSLMNWDYLDTCRYWDDEHDHNDCWLLHPYSPYVLPDYVDPVEKDKGEHLSNNWGPDQILPYWFLEGSRVKGCDVDKYVPLQNQDPEFIKEQEERKAAEAAQVKTVAKLFGASQWVDRLADNLTTAIQVPASLYLYSREYSDVAPDAWYYKAISSLSEGGLVNGMDDGTFQPMGEITHAQFSNILAKAKGLDAATTSDYWAAGAIQACVKQGYIPDLGKILPENYDTPISREAATAGLMKALPDDLKKEAADAPEIPDRADISAEYLDGVLDAYKFGVAKGGEDGSFNPKGTLTRAEFCQLLFNAGWTDPA